MRNLTSLVTCSVITVYLPVFQRNVCVADLHAGKCVWMWVCVSWTCSLTVCKSFSPRSCVFMEMLFSWQTSHSSHRLDVQKWFYFSIERQVSIILDAIEDIKPVIFTVVVLIKNIAWRHVTNIMIEW